jgi:hypothetical protein
MIIQAYLLLSAYYQHVLGDYPASIGTYEKVDWAGEMDTTGHEMGLSLMAQRVDWLRGMVVYGQSGGGILAGVHVNKTS